MPAKIATLADAVKDALADATFSQEITVERRYIPALKLEDLEADAGVIVLVVPRSNEIENLSRSDRQKTVDISIGIQKRLTQAADPGNEAANEELDEMLLLVEEIAEHFAPGAYGGAKWVRTRNDPIFDPEDLLNNRTFASLVTVTFKYL
jgi:hypothetical protein